MAIPRSTQDCYPGHEQYEAKFRCDQCGITQTVTGEGHMTEYRARKIIASEWAWSSTVNPSDTRKTPGRLDYCANCMR